jgi:hypothetical protein
MIVPKDESDLSPPYLLTIEIPPSHLNLRINKSFYLKLTGCDFEVHSSHFMVSK